MFRSYFTIAWRNFLQNKVAFLINIGGLSAGMTCFIVIFLYVNYELSFDRWRPHAEGIYRVVKDFVNDDGTRIPDATTSPALAPALRREVPEVKTATRFASGGRQYLVQYRDKSFYETSLLRIDSNFFDVFGISYLKGSKAASFRDPRSIVLTETMAKKYFGDADPIGQLLHMNLNGGRDYAVTGVVSDVPRNSHFTWDLLIPWESTRDSSINDNWNWSIFYTYVLLKDHANAASFQEKIQPVFNRHQPTSKDVYYAQALTDIHLQSKLKWELGVNNDIAYIRILIIVGVFVIVIAGINYVNLVTARSIRRAKEVGVRKVIGASRSLLVRQFLTESVCSALIAFFVSLIATQLLLPLVNRIIDRELSLPDANHWPLFGQLFAICAGVGLIAGLYPAVYLSGFRPARVLKGRFMASLESIYLRKGLVICQFVISITLMVSFFTIYRQVEFIQNKDLGFNKSNLLMVPNVRSTGRNVLVPPGSWVNEVRKIPAVSDVARAEGEPGGVVGSNGVSFRNQHLSLNFMRIDHAFLSTMQISLKEGRNFFAGFGRDSASVILNEKAVGELGVKPPYLGQQLVWDLEDGRSQLVTIVGVVKDFHFFSLHEAIRPFAFIAEENNGSNFFIKLRSQNLPKEIAAIEEAWTKFNPDKPFYYKFLDEQVSKLYQSDVRFQRLFFCVTLLAMFIACLGLLGLSIFTSEARDKEMGIRKVLGASAGSLFGLLCKDILWLLVIAFGVAIPIAWGVMHSWLQGYPYHIALSWWMFAGCGIVAIVLALGTTSFHAIKAALINPTRVLRSE